MHGFGASKWSELFQSYTVEGCEKHCARQRTGLAFERSTCGAHDQSMSVEWLIQKNKLARHQANEAAKHMYIPENEGPAPCISPERVRF